MVDAETEEPGDGFGPEARGRREACGPGGLREELGAVGEPECGDEPCVEGGHRYLRGRRRRRSGLCLRQAGDDAFQLSLGEGTVGSRRRRLGHDSCGHYGLELGLCPRSPRLGGGCCRGQCEEHYERPDIRKAAAAHICPIGESPYLFNLITVDVEITPGPTEDQRRAILEALEKERQAATAPSPWRRAGLGPGPED